MLQTASTGFALSFLFLLLGGITSVRAEPGWMPQLLSYDTLLSDDRTLAKVLVAADNSTTTVVSSGLGDIACVHVNATGYAATPPPLQSFCSLFVVYIGAGNASGTFVVACNPIVALLRCGANSVDVLFMVKMPLQAVVDAPDDRRVVVFETRLFVLNERLETVATLPLLHNESSAFPLLPPIAVACSVTQVTCWIGDANGALVALSWLESNIPRVAALATPLRGPMMLSSGVLNTVVAADDRQVVRCVLQPNGTALSMHTVNRSLYDNATIVAIEASQRDLIFFIATSAGQIFRANVGDSVAPTLFIALPAGAQINTLTLDPNNSSRLFVAASGSVSGAVVDTSSMLAEWQSTASTGGGIILFAANDSPVLCIPNLLNYTFYPPQNLGLPPLVNPIHPLRIVGSRLFSWTTSFSQGSTILIKVFDAHASVVNSADAGWGAVALDDGRLVTTQFGINGSSIDVRVVDLTGAATTLTAVQGAVDVSLYVMQPDLVVVEGFVPGGLLSLISINVTDRRIVNRFNLSTNTASPPQVAATAWEQGRLVQLLSSPAQLLTFDASDGSHFLGVAFASNSPVNAIGVYEPTLSLSPSGEYVAASRSTNGDTVVIAVATGEVVYNTPLGDALGVSFAHDGGLAICHASGAVSYSDAAFHLVNTSLPIGCVGKPIFAGSQWYQPAEISNQDGGYATYIARVSFPFVYSAIPAVLLVERRAMLTMGVYSPSEQILVVTDTVHQWAGAVDLIGGTILWTSSEEPPLVPRNPRVATATVLGATNAVLSQTANVRDLFTGTSLEEFKCPVQAVVDHGGDPAVLITCDGSFYLYSGLTGVTDVAPPAAFRSATAPPFQAGPTTTLPFTYVPTPSTPPPRHESPLSTGVVVGIVVSTIVGSALLIGLGVKLRSLYRASSAPRLGYDAVQDAEGVA